MARAQLSAGAMRQRDIACCAFAILHAPSFPKPVWRVEAACVLRGENGFSFTRDAPQHRVDERLKMHCARILLRETVGAIDRGMGRNLEDKKLSCAEQQDFQRRARFVRSQGFGNEGMDERIELPEMAQRTRTKFSEQQVFPRPDV